MKSAFTSHPDASVMVSFASLRSVYETVLEALEYPQIRVIAIIAEGVPENLTRKLIKHSRMVTGPCKCSLSLVNQRRDTRERGGGKGEDGRRTKILLVSPHISFFSYRFGFISPVFRADRSDSWRRKLRIAHVEPMFYIVQLYRTLHDWQFVMLKNMPGFGE
uniref:CoA-binding domain-containing protein n=1 Tax=Parascaris equorum TaxID=6256 RepID=A0A914R4A7_PAREQ